MITASSVVELAGSRVFRPQPPRGTPSRILSVRLYRCFHQHGIQSHNRHNNTIVTTLASSRSLLKTTSSPLKGKIDSHGYATIEEPPATITEPEYALIQDLLNRYPNGLPKASKHNEETHNEMERASQTAYNLLPNPFKSAIKAVQQKDTRRLLIYLRRITQLPQDQLKDALASLPRSTFDEFLRLLDPFYVGRDADPTDGVNITTGMFTMLNLESTVDDWGVRKLYLRLLQRVMMMVKALREAGYRLNAQEYTCLLRCAGAASDVMTAKQIWYDMQRTEDNFWRQSDLYYEFVRARMLTEPLYLGYDKTRRMVYPRNLHRSKITLSRYQLKHLDRLRVKLRSRRLHFSLNKRVDHAEDFHRILRKRKPPRRLFYHILRNGHAPTEKLLCTLMVAFARAGSLRFIGSRILEDYFGINVTRLNYDDIDVKETIANPTVVASGFRVRPTVRLMEAVVEAYGCKSEIAMAVQLVEYISHIIKIPVPPHVWLALLEWTYLAGSPPASTSWKRAGMLRKIPPPDAVNMIWDAMIAAQDNSTHHHAVEPSFAHRAVLIKHLLGRHMFESAIPHLRIARRDYEAQLRALEDAALEYVQTLRDGGVPASMRALAQYERARFRARTTWYNLQSWTRKLLTGWRPIVGGSGPDDVDSSAAYSRFAHRVVPDLVAEFRQGDADVLPNPICYRTPTGYVNLWDPCRELARSVFVRSVVNDVPVPVYLRGSGSGSGSGGRPGFVLRRVHQRRLAVLSSRSLAPQTASRLDPMTLLGGRWDSFRTVQVPKWRRGRNVDAGQRQLGQGPQGQEEGDFDDDD